MAEKENICETALNITKLLQNRENQPRTSIVIRKTAVENCRKSKDLQTKFLNWQEIITIFSPIFDKVF